MFGQKLPKIFDNFIQIFFFFFFLSLLKKKKKKKKNTFFFGNFSKIQF